VVWSWHAFANREPQGRVLAAYERFGTSGVERFLPYWKNGDMAACATPDVKATLFVKAGKVLVALGNRGHEEREAEVKLDLGKLGLGGEVTAIDACTGGVGPVMEGGRLRVRVPGRGFAMVLVEGRKWGESHPGDPSQQHKTLPAQDDTVKQKGEGKGRPPHATTRRDIKSRPTENERRKSEGA
jgi:hypothetical protein